MAIPQEPNQRWSLHFASYAFAYGRRLRVLNVIDEIESFNGRYRDECLNERLFPSLPAASEILEAWRASYNTVRPNSSLGGMESVKSTKLPRHGHEDRY